MIKATNKKLIYTCREEIAKTYAVLKNCIPGHTYYYAGGHVWDKDFPKAWPYETKDEIETVNDIAKWHSGDPDLGRIEIAKANVTSVIFNAKYQGPKFDFDEIEDGLGTHCYSLSRTSPATQFVAIINEQNNSKYWINGAFAYDKEMPQLLPYETKHEKDSANKIADTYAKDSSMGKVSLVMINISKSIKVFSEKKRIKIDRSAMASLTKKKAVAV